MRNWNLWKNYEDWSLESLLCPAVSSWSLQKTLWYQYCWFLSWTYHYLFKLEKACRSHWKLKVWYLKAVPLNFRSIPIRSLSSPFSFVQLIWCQFSESKHSFLLKLPEFWGFDNESSLLDSSFHVRHMHLKFAINSSRLSFSGIWSSLTRQGFRLLNNLCFYFEKSAL